MFNKSWKAQVGKFELDTRKQAGNNEDETVGKLTLLYDFDGKIATELGGAAPKIFEGMVMDTGDGASLKRTPLKLKSKGVNVRIGPKGSGHAIKDTIGLNCWACPPTGNGQTPALEVVINFLPSKQDVVFIFDNQGRRLGTKMDREQLEIPMTASEEETEQ